MSSHFPYYILPLTLVTTVSFFFIFSFFVLRFHEYCVVSKGILVLHTLYVQGNSNITAGASVYSVYIYGNRFDASCFRLKAFFSFVFVRGNDRVYTVNLLP